MSASTCVQDALYADDLTLIAETRRELQHMITTLDKACDRWSMSINDEKIKILTVGESLTESESPIKLKDHTLGEVESYSYLGSELDQTTKVEREVMVRLK